VAGYESAWLADLAMAFLLEMMDQNVFDKTKYFGIYCDDGIAIFPGVWTQTEVADWFLTFQGAINDTGGRKRQADVHSRSMDPRRRYGTKGWR
jgi:hypothetical protein